MLSQQFVVNPQFNLVAVAGRGDGALWLRFSFDEVLRHGTTNQGTAVLWECGPTVAPVFEKGTRCFESQGVKICQGAKWAIGFRLSAFGYPPTKLSMLSEKIATVVAALPYQSDAKWEVNILPFGSIYWNDEMPAIRDLIDKLHDMSVIFKMFGMRIRLWDGEILNAEDQQLWNAVRDQVPNWALFSRLSLSEEQRLARQEAERQVEQEFESLGSDSDSAEG